jgi:TonB family protein
VFKSQASHLSWLRPVVSRAIALNPDARKRLLGAWLQAAPPGAWRATLDDLGTEALESVQPVIVEALTSANPVIRQETVWAVVKKLAGGRHVPEPILDAALRATDESGAGASPTWEAFGRELVARRYRQVRTPSRAVLIASEAASHRSDARLIATFKELTPGERGALSETLGATLSENPPEAPEQERRGQPVMRTLAIPWPALLPDLLQVSGCPIADTLRAGAFEIDYRPDGRPLSVGVIPYDLPPTCKPALEALARMTLADVAYDIVEGDKQLVVVLVSNEQLACLPEALEPEAGGERIGAGRITQPAKIRDVRPAYPETLVRSRVQGVVVAEAIISRTGCPGSVKVMKSVHALLDFEAVKAVSRWRFTPTLLNGAPVPVVMTVTVNYTLK